MKYQVDEIIWESLTEEELDLVKRTDKILGKKTVSIPLSEIIRELVELIESKEE